MQDEVSKVWQKLCTLRREQGVSQATMAARLRTTQGRLSKLENKRPDLLHVYFIVDYAKALGLDVKLSLAKTKTV